MTEGEARDDRGGSGRQGRLPLRRQGYRGGSGRQGRLPLQGHGYRGDARVTEEVRADRDVCPYKGMVTEVIGIKKDPLQ